MSKREKMLRELCRQLGGNYAVRTIDFERCLYRDFGNGFNVEISGVNTTKADRPATLYLWFGESPPDCLIVKTMKDVERAGIGDAVEELRDYSNHLILCGYATRDALFHMRHPELKIKHTKF